MFLIVTSDHDGNWYKPTLNAYSMRLAESDARTEAIVEPADTAVLR